MSEMHENNRNAMPTGWIVAVLVVIVVWAVAFAWRSSGEKVVMVGWQDGLAAGQVVAKESDRTMIVLFTAGWCAPCQVLKKDVLTKGDVHDALQADFVPVQIDLTDNSASNPNSLVAQRYGVSGIPTVIAMTADGKPIEAFNGEHTPAGFNAWLSRLAE